ncbi:MAG: aminotransferase class V-fold PLP-dependent enzyme [Caldimonas sp.]
MTRMTMPEFGKPSEAVLAELRARKANDIDWEGGKAPLFVFKASDDVSEMGRAAFFEYFFENALGAGRAFPSVKQMETEVVEMALGLFHAPTGAKGFMSTGGTESILEAIQTCRDFTRAKRGNKQLRGNIVAPESIHPAFDKGARLMDLEVRRIPVRADFRADVIAMEAAIDENTIMVAGSAPCFCYGVIDPLTELAVVAKSKGLWMHVDACVGGYVAPFVKMIGRAIPDFDFSIEGVCSISADLHKFGFCPKPASTVFYRDADMAKFHAFDFNNWPNGRFYTTTICGTRPAGGVAGAWAVFNYLGIEGYKRIATELMGFIDKFKEGVQKIPSMRIVGNPDLSIVAYTSDEIDVFRVAELMQAQGYLPGLLQRPKALHQMMSLVHARACGTYLKNLQAAVDVVREAPRDKAVIDATY